MVVKTLGTFSSTNEALQGHDLSGKVAIVTGGNRGIGIETVRGLAQGGAKVYMGSRSVQAGEQSKQELLKSDDIKGEIVVAQLDVGDFESINNFVAQFKQKEQRLNYLVLNAGVIANELSYTKHNFESTFGICHMGHFYLTQELIPFLQQQEFQSRIIVVSSYGYTQVKEIRLDNLNYRNIPYNGFKAYQQSKLCNVQFARALNQRYGSENGNIKAYVLHPGLVGTDMVKSFKPSKSEFINFLGLWAFKTMAYMMGMPEKSINQGASTSVYACVSDFKEDTILMDCKETPLKKHALDNEQRDKLWKISVAYVEEVKKNGKIEY